LAVPRLHLGRARDREGSSEIAWCTDYWRGECPGKGWWWRELKEANKPPCWTKYTKTAPKKRNFPALFGLKIIKNGIFCSKYLISYTPKTFLRKILF
jgi:hypothetical protein